MVEDITREDLRQKDLYIAGPFFTPEQLEIVEQIEIMCDHYGIKYFSPRQEGGVD